MFAEWLRKLADSVTRKLPLFRDVYRTGRALGGDLLAAYLWLRHRGNPDAGVMRGTFSAFEGLKAGAPCVQGRIISEGQAIAPFIVGSLSDLCGYQQHGRPSWPIFWRLFENAHLVGASLMLLDDSKRGCKEARYHEDRPTDSPLHYVFGPPVTRLKGNWTSLSMRWTVGFNYYHWLHDALPLLAVLDEFPSDTKILVQPELNHFQKETLEILGLTERIRPTPERNLRVERFYFSAPPAMTGCYNPYAAEFLRRKFLPHGRSERPLPEKFYILRRVAGRGISNAEAVIRLFERLGWGIIDTAELTVREQIALFAGAKAICGVHGAAFANLVWCAPDCKVLEICTSTFLNGCYETLARVVGCEHQFKIYEGDGLHQMTVDVAEIEAIVSKW